MLRLEEYGESGIVEPGQKDEVEHVPDARVNFGGKIEYVARRIWYLPRKQLESVAYYSRDSRDRGVPDSRWILVHRIQLDLGLVKRQHGEGIVGEGENRTAGDGVYA